MRCLGQGFPNHLPVWARVKAVNDIQPFAKHGESNIAYVTKRRETRAVSKR